MTSLKTSIKTITYLSDIGCLEIQGASLDNKTDKRRQRRDEAADAEVLSRILDIIGDTQAAVPK